MEARESATLALFGDLDAATADDIRAMIDRAVAANPAGVKLDLAEVEFLDATGIGMLLSAKLAAEAAGRSLEVIRPKDRHRMLLTIVGLEDVFGVPPLPPPGRR